MANNSCLIRVELTLANGDDADCNDNYDNDLDYEGDIELVNAGGMMTSHHRVCAVHQY